MTAGDGGGPDRHQPRTYGMGPYGQQMDRAGQGRAKMAD